MDSRNRQIYLAWVYGKDYPELAKEFNLGIETIKGICHENISSKVKQTYWQTKDSYKAYRAFIKKKLEEEKQ